MNRTDHLAFVLDLLNVNGVTYQVINKEEFGKTYIKVTILSQTISNNILSLFYSVYQFDEQSRYFDLGDDIFVTFDQLEVQLDEDDISFGQRFLREFCDEIISAECIGGNVNVFMNKLPDGVGKYIAKAQKTVAKDFNRYAIKKDKKTLNITVKK